MNMFKKSRKAKDQDDALGALTGSDPVPTSKTSRGLTRKKKNKGVVEEQPLFDLGSALPNNNDFRTSLLMPNLSARFSMLREQDDPSTKLGKASDDSVLFPKRASRLMLFNNNVPLSDIAEVDSVYSSFRPPFAEDPHMSMSDGGYASDDGASMMNRSRPGESNNLFGGRQKLYKVPTSSSKNLPVEGGMTHGRHTYESDVSLSAFQQMRLKEKEQERQRELDERTHRSSMPNTEPEDQSSARSPLTGFSQNRGTQSSTNSGPSNRRTSTAATSVVSDSPAQYQSTHAVVNKVKNHDANSSAESIGFASSPSFRKGREENGPPAFKLAQPRSASNIRSDYSRQSPVPPQGVFRGASPPLGTNAEGFDFGSKDSTISATPSRFNTASPTSHFSTDRADPLSRNVRPNDRGKATALGLFNKPAQHYDDAQFQQRQMQMYEGRTSPISANSRAASRASAEHVPPEHTSYASTSSHMPDNDRHTPPIPPIPGQPSSPESNRRTSAGSSRKSTSRPRTKSSASSKEASVKARVESLIRKQNAELAALEATHVVPPVDIGDDYPSTVEKNQSSGTFFDGDGDSDDESEQHRVSVRSMTNETPPPLPLLDMHPALRRDRADSFTDFNFGTEPEKLSQPHAATSLYTPHVQSSADVRGKSEYHSTINREDADSPTIPAAGLGLSGLIRTHLRHDSDRSSMLPPPSPLFPPANESRDSVASTTRTAAESVKSDPFEYDSERTSTPQQASLPPQAPQAPLTPTITMSLKAQQILGTAMALRDAHANSEATPKMGSHSAGQAHDADREKVHDDGLSHQRSESTETQKEMQRFDEELAARRKRIEESLNTVQERSRSRSPVAERIHGHAGNGFTLPRFPGRSNTGDRPEPTQSKAMRMLGMSGPTKDHQSPAMIPENFDRDNSRALPFRSGGRHPHAQDQEEPKNKHVPNNGSAAKPGHGYNYPPPSRSNTPSSRPGNRIRSNSAVADRSQSRNRHHHDAMPGAFPGSPFTGPSPRYDDGQWSHSSAARPYERSGSSAAGHYPERPGYFNSRPLAPPGLSNGFTPRPSPRPSPNPAGQDDSFQPPTMASMSPPPSTMASPKGMGNGRTTPTANSGRITPSGNRKRSVTKGMISEPTFVSSTSTVPLVQLPRDGGTFMEPQIPPPVPAMNPRRRGNTPGENPPQSAGPSYTAVFSPHPGVRPNASPLPMMPGSATTLPETFNYNRSAQDPPPRQRNKLRKSSSEGGNMATRARQQALMVDLAREKDRSPNVAVFPNKSTTSLATRDGPMF